MLGLAAMAQVCFAAAVPAQATPLTTRVNVSSAGEQAGASRNTLGGISGDGRYVAFSSNADNLVARDTNGVRDVFVHDRTTGATRRVSLSSRGHQANRPSGWPRLSGDGGSVVFRSRADNLVAGDDDGHRDIFVHDLATRRTTIESVSSAGEQADANSNFPDISGDGRFVVFNTWASNITDVRANDGPGIAMNVYLRDRRAGTTTLVSRNPWRSVPHEYSGSATLSADGRFVAYTARAGADGAFVYDIERHSTRAYGHAAGVADSGRYAVALTLSATGRFFSTREEDAQENGIAYVHDRESGDVLELPRGVEGIGSISSDGRWLGTASLATDLVPGDTNGRLDTFVYDRTASAMTRLSVGPAGEEMASRSFGAIVSADGRFAAFPSSASRLVVGDTNHSRDIFVRGPLGG